MAGIVVAFAAAGAFLGGMGLSLLVILFTALFARSAFGDGQYMLVFFFTVPVGGFFGAVAGCATALVRRGHIAGAGSAGVMAGGLLGVLGLSFAGGSDS